MKSKQDVLKKLMTEIHQICIKNEIEYFVPNEYAPAINKDFYNRGSRIDPGYILMTASNLDKFVKTCNSQINENRVIEWLGNNDSFPGLFVRYIDIGTTYYTHRRFIYEKFLGIYITIHLLRPQKKKSIYFRTLEHAYINIIQGKKARGKKLEPILRKYLLKRIETKGQSVVTRGILHRLLIQYNNTKKCKKFWIITEDLSVKYFELDELLSGELEFKKNVYQFSNNMDFFCDSEISYKDLGLEQYQASIKEILTKEEQIKYRIHSYQIRKKNLIDQILKLYDKY